MLPLLCEPSALQELVAAPPSELLIVDLGSDERYLAEHLPGASRILVGPWAHTYPHIAQPGPQAGFLQEAVNWWDRWLKGVHNETDQLPRLRLWLQDPAPPASS